MTAPHNWRACAKVAMLRHWFERQWRHLPPGRAFVGSPTRALPWCFGVQPSHALMCPPEVGPGACSPKETAG